MPRKDVKFNSTAPALLDKATAEETKNQAPAQRFQNDQADGSAIVDSGKTTAGVSEFKYKKTGSKGTPLKTSVISEVITGDKGFSGAAAQQATALGRSGFKSLAYSGDAGTILGNPASTPVVGTADRASSRGGKILDATNKKINYLASEQVLVEYDQPAPLSEQEDGIGYNGTPMNSVARGQKSYGSNPGDLLFDRSVDEISRDVAVFVSGQALGEEGIQYGDAPTSTLEAPNYLTPKGTDAYAVGNFMPDYLEIKFGKENGKAYLAKFQPHTIDLSLNSCSADVINDAAQNRIIDMNNAEIVRQDIDVKAGRETEPNWSPLARAVQQPTATLGYLHDLEAEMGAMVYSSMRLFSKAHAYQLNKASKDGQRVVEPIAEMFFRHLTGAYSSKQFAGLGSVGELLDDAALKTLPSADKFIGVFDSPTKYATKADVLTQPRSLKMHYSTARSNSGMFRVKPEFVEWLDRQDFFSTIDHEYDPLSPVYITDGFKYVCRHDWAKQFAFSRNGVNASRTYSTDAFVYSYVDRMSMYNVVMGNPTLSAIAYFLEQHAQRFSKYFGDEPIKIPVASYTKSFSLWDLLVMAATPYMQYERSQCFKDILDFERNFEYPFRDLVKLADVLDAPRKHYNFNDIGEPLVSKVVSGVDAITWTLPAQYYHIGTATDGVNAKLYLLPHYFSELQFEFGDDHTVRMLKGFKHTLKPVIRSGVKYGLVDQFYGNSDMQTYLVYDPEVVPATLMDIEDGKLIIKDEMAEGYVHKYSQNAAGLVVAADNRDFDMREVMGVPRVLGWYFVLPAAVARAAGYEEAIGTNLLVPFETPDEHRDTVLSKCIGGALTAYSYCATSYSNDAAIAKADALGGGTLAVGRGQNFAQQWFEYRSLLDYIEAAYDTNKYPALSLNIYERASNASGNGVTAPRASFYILNGDRAGATGLETVKTSVNGAMSSVAELLWTRLQRLQFIVNPFAMAGSKTGFYKDPYDLARLLNMAGFMDLDFSVANNDRIYNIQEQGWLFVLDPWMSEISK